jgi:hypothetical protein
MEDAIMPRPQIPDHGDASPILEAIPDPETIRRRMAALLREQMILRGLLRVAERHQELCSGDQQKLDQSTVTRE